MMLSGSFFQDEDTVIHVHTKWRVNVLQNFGELNRGKNFVENDDSSSSKSNLRMKRKLLDLNPQVVIKRMSKSKVPQSVILDDQIIYSRANMNESIHKNSSEDMHTSGECLPMTALEYETLNNKLTISEMKLAERKMKVTSLKIRLASMERKLSEERLSAQNKDKKIYELERMLESKNKTIDELTKLNPSKYLIGRGDVNKVVEDLEFNLIMKETLVIKLEESLKQREKDIAILKNSVSELEVKLNDKDIYINTLEDSFKLPRHINSLESRVIGIDTIRKSVDNDCKDLARSGENVKNEYCSLPSESDLANSLAHDHGYANARQERLLSVKSFANEFRIGNVGNVLMKDEAITLDENS